MFYNIFENHEMYEIHWKAKKNMEERAVMISSCLEGIFSFIASVMFLFCMKKCILLLFPMQKFPRHFILYSFFAMIPAMLLITFVRGRFPDHKKWVYPGIAVLYSGIVFFVAWKHQEELYTCSMNLFENYLAQVNTYYRVHVTAGGDLQVTDNRFGILFWGILIHLFYLITGKIFSKKYLLCMPSLLFLVLLFAVGKVPGYSVFALGFAGAVTIFFRDFYRVDGLSGRLVGKGIWKNSKSVMVFAMLFLCFLGIGIPVFSKIAFGKKTEKIMAYVPSAKKFQLELENTVEAVYFSLFDKDTEVVDNKSPEYFDKEVLEVTMDGKLPGENQYFRETYWTDYENGQWTTDEEVFPEKCIRSGYEPEAFSEFLAFPANSYFQQKKYGKSDFENSKIEQREVTLSYKGLKGGHVALPYMLGEMREEKEPEFVRDAYLEKDTFQKEYHFSVWDPTYLEDTTMSSGLHYEEVEALYQKEDQGEEKMQDWYDRYVVEHYLNYASGDVPSISEIAMVLQNLIGYPYEDPYGDHMQIEGDWQQNVTLTGDISEWAGEWMPDEKTGIWQITDCIQSYLRHYQYSLDLDDIGLDTDPLEYFLVTSHNGYCVHFASAGVLLLRAMGVPARYATGYVVHPKDWSKNADGSYTAKVFDYNAHAWAEVYFEGIGWVPVEMTPSAEENIRTVEREKERMQPVGTEAPKQTKKPEQENISKSTETPKPSPVSAERNGNKPGNGKRGFGNGTGAGSTGRSFLLITFAALAGIIFWTFYHWGIGKRKRRITLSADRKSFQNRMEVCRINHLIFRRLCRKRHMRKREISDKEYQLLLQTTYPEKDWNAFMKIVRKASFSRNEITEEEVMFCHELLTHF